MAFNPNVRHAPHHETLDRADPCLCSRQEQGGGRARTSQAVGEREPARLQSGGDASADGTRSAEPLSRSRCHRAARSDRRAPRDRPCPDRVRHRVRRMPPRCGAGLCRAGRRGGGLALFLLALSTARAQGRGRNRLGRGRGLRARCRQSARRRYPAHARRAAGQSEQSGRFMAVARRGQAASRWLA